MDALCQSLLDQAKVWEKQADETFSIDADTALRGCVDDLRNVLDKHKVGRWS
jgi:uncharacterized protein with von Willebrand factor type A (vWA) domain